VSRPPGLFLYKSESESERANDRASASETGIIVSRPPALFLYLSAREERESCVHDTKTPKNIAAFQCDAKMIAQAGISEFIRQL
jgi:hypothetical protein